MAVGLRTVVPSSFSDEAASAQALIDALWVDVGGCLGGEHSDVLGDRFAITTPADSCVPPLRITYVAAVVHDGGALVPGLEALVIDGGLFAVYGFHGPTDDVDDFYRTCYVEDLPATDYETREGQHLERVLARSSERFVTLEAWIPVVAKATTGNSATQPN